MRRTASKPEKGNSSERVGRKANGLNPCGDMAAWLPGERAVAVCAAHPLSEGDSCDCVRRSALRLGPRARVPIPAGSDLSTRRASHPGRPPLRRLSPASLHAGRVSSTTRGDDYGLLSGSYGMVERCDRGCLLVRLADPHRFACGDRHPRLGCWSHGHRRLHRLLRRSDTHLFEPQRCRHHDHHQGRRSRGRNDVLLRGDGLRRRRSSRATIRTKSARPSLTLLRWSPSARAPAAAPPRRR